MTSKFCRMSQTFPAEENHMVSSLTKEDWLRWQVELKLINLEAGSVLFEIGDPLTYVYFPTTAIISITRSLIDGELFEVAMIGREGVAGASTLLGNGVTASRGIVLRSGKAYRIRGTWIKNEFANSPHLRDLMLNFTQALITQISQVSACSCHHSLDKRLCRWLLVFADRTETTEILCTQEQLANTLGVRRERLNKAANLLQRKGMIQYRRGSIHLMNKLAMKQHVCECYGIIKAAFTQLAAKVTY